MTTTARLAAFGTTTFAEMSVLTVRTGVVDLGQGSPDTDGPQGVPVTAGATGAMTDAIIALTQPGDEVLRGAGDRLATLR